jgi:hypothetical protein
VEVDPETFWYDPDPALFVGDLPDANKNNFFHKLLYAYSFLKVQIHHSLKIEVIKKSHNSRNPDFFPFFSSLLMEGSGSVQINYGSGYGSRRPKNIRIRTGYGTLPETTFFLSALDNKCRLT